MLLMLNLHQLQLLLNRFDIRPFFGVLVIKRWNLESLCDVYSDLGQALQILRYLVAELLLNPDEGCVASLCIHGRVL